jgi:hypothetical protein
MQSNYMAIHAVSFHRSLVDAGVRFGRDLKTFEDWDFWIQLAQRTDFAFTGHPTGCITAPGGTSGAGAGANLDKECRARPARHLMRKWKR